MSSMLITPKDHMISLGGSQSGAPLLFRLDFRLDQSRQGRDSYPIRNDLNVLDFLE